MSNAPLLLGLLGGMGPSATADVFNKIIANTPASSDQEHIPIIVRSVPQIPDRTEALLKGGASPESALAAGARSLCEAGAQLIAITCNTAHHWYDVVAAASNVPVLHIATAVLAELDSRGARGARLGLMATDGTMASGFYQRRLSDAGYDLTTPSLDTQTHLVTPSILLAKAGRWEEARSCAGAAAEELLEAGAEIIVLGCTELPLALSGWVHADAHALDANLALARACVRRAMPTSTLVL
jgi:aspartate racemase